MYKITLFDCNCPGFVSGTVNYYCEDIHRFEEEWVKLEIDQERVRRFKRSLAGEFVTDYYTDDEELNIVQEDKHAEIYFEKDVLLRDKEIELFNSYQCSERFRVHALKIHMAFVRFQGTFLRLMSYRIEGIAMLEHVWGKYAAVHCHGNRILKSTHPVFAPDYSDRIEDFDDAVIETIAYIPMGDFCSFEEMKRSYRKKGVSRKEIAGLLVDIMGESG